jgi:hypothetical protein
MSGDVSVTVTLSPAAAGFLLSAAAEMMILAACMSRLTYGVRKSILFPVIYREEHLPDQKVSFSDSPLN